MSMTIRCQSCYLEIPQELTCLILENLRNDTSSLKHCSLVCRAWLNATRTYLFRRAILTPKNIEHFTLLFIDSLSTIRSHVRRLELRRIDCSNRRVTANFTSTLTRLHLHDMTFNAFIDILDVICSFPYLQSVALDELTIETNPSETSARIQNKVLPSSVNSLRYRDSQYLRTLTSWLLHHKNIPKLSNFDIGPIDEENTFEVGKYLVSIGPALKRFSFSFKFGYNVHACTLQPKLQTRLTDDHATPLKIFSAAKRFKELFGLEVCRDLGSLTGLQSLQFDNFIHFGNYTIQEGVFWGPRVIASIRAMNIREVVLGVSLRRAGELDKFNIRWEFLDEVFTSMDGSYANLVSLKFEITGRVNIDGIASLIRSRLPGCEKRGILQFCRENLNYKHF